MGPGQMPKNVTKRSPHARLRGPVIRSGSGLRADETIRILGSLLVIAGWFAVLNASTTIGGALSLVGDCLALPWATRVRAWDVVIMIVILHLVTIQKLAQGGFTGMGASMRYYINRSNKTTMKKVYTIKYIGRSPQELRRNLLQG